MLGRENRFPALFCQLRTDLKTTRCIGLFLAGFVLSHLQSAGAVTFEIADAVAFNKIISTNSLLTTNYNYGNNPPYLEGPVWVPSAGGYLVYSEMGNNKLKKLVPPGTLGDFWAPPANTKCNGNMLDLQERLVTCEAGSAGFKLAIVATNGTVTPLVTQYTNGLKFYSPNDLTVKSDGSIWFTDPAYDSGVSVPSSGYQPTTGVYRFFETNGNATVLQVINNMSRPNGICLSPDETKLYVADTTSDPGFINVYNVTSSNTVTGGSRFCTVAFQAPDGIKCDVAGNVWAATGSGVEIYAPDGHLIGKIRLTRVINLCFGGPQYKTLYMVGAPLVTSIPVLVPGVPAIKKLQATAASNQLNLAWPAPSTGFALQATSGSLTTWTNVTQPPAVTNGFNVVSLETTNAVRLFRLRLN